MKSEVNSIREKLAKIDKCWSPKIIDQMNDYHIKLAKIKGDFTWHDHKDTDELFYVVSGEMRIDFRDKSVALKTGDMYVVPKGVDHKPYAENECHIMLIEPAGTVNTGAEKNEQTAPNNEWI